jgi:hypothetical protein
MQESSLATCYHKENQFSEKNSKYPGFFACALAKNRILFGTWNHEKLPKLQFFTNTTFVNQFKIPKRQSWVSRVTKTYWYLHKPPSLILPFNTMHQGSSLFNELWSGIVPRCVNLAIPRFVFHIGQGRYQKFLDYQNFSTPLWHKSSDSQNPNESQIELTKTKRIPNRNLFFNWFEWRHKNNGSQWKVQ